VWVWVTNGAALGNLSLSKSEQTRKRVFGFFTLREGAGMMRPHGLIVKWI
jgi:hypothetical protein